MTTGQIAKTAREYIYIIQPVNNVRIASPRYSTLLYLAVSSGGRSVARNTVG